MKAWHITFSYECLVLLISYEVNKPFYNVILWLYPFIDTILTLWWRKCKLRGKVYCTKFSRYGPCFDIVAVLGVTTFSASSVSFCSASSHPPWRRWTYCPHFNRRVKSHLHDISTNPSLWLAVVPVMYLTFSLAVTSCMKVVVIQTEFGTRCIFLFLFYFCFYLNLTYFFIF